MLSSGYRLFGGGGGEGSGGRGQVRSTSWQGEEVQEEEGVEEAQRRALLNMHDDLHEMLMMNNQLHHEAVNGST